MKVLVTGGAGFIGSTLCHRLLDDGCRVVALDLLTYAANPMTVAELNERAGFTLEIADVADAGAVAAILQRHRPDRVIHLAAETHVDRSIDSPGSFITTNIVGTYTLLEETLRYWRGLGGNARQSFRVVLVSTDEVFGSLGPDGVFDESSPYSPNSPYAASKAASDHLARAWHATYGLPVVVTHCSNNYGPRQFPEKLIPLMITNASAGRSLPVYGDGGQVRDWLHVDDHAEALIAVMRRAAPGAVYTIGGDSARANLDLVRALCAELDEALPDSPHRPHAGLIVHVADRPGHDRRYATDSARISAELGWSPRISFADGLARTVRWYMDNPRWCAACGDAAARRRGLGEGGE